MADLSKYTGGGASSPVFTHVLDRIEELIGPNLKTDTCAVKQCSGDHVMVVKLLPFDPIDHNASLVPLCDHHREWAGQRNEFVEQMHDELRTCRQEVGKANSERIAELQSPPGGEIGEGVSLSGVDEAMAAVSAIHDLELPEGNGGDHD